MNCDFRECESDEIAVLSAKDYNVLVTRLLVLGLENEEAAELACRLIASSNIVGRHHLAAVLRPS